MTKQTKNIITFEDCKKNLLADAKSNLMQIALIFGVSLLLFTPAAIAIIFHIDKLGFWSVLLLLLCSVPSCLIPFIVIDLKTLRLIQSNKFSVVKDTIVRLSKDELARNYREGIRLTNAIYFREHGRSTATNYNFDFLAVGDECYVVVLHSKRKKVCLVYQTSIYEYKE